MATTTLREMIEAGIEKRYWVQAETHHTRNKVVAYTVWTLAPDHDGYEQVHRFPIHKKDGPDAAMVALKLANMSRDDLNAGVE